MGATPANQLPIAQAALVLRGVRQKYELHTDHPVPIPSGEDEYLLQTEAIGLNPIDWKSPDFGFGIPSLPFLSGREASGKVLTPPRSTSRLRLGDRVAFISTNYRDYRKATFQQYVLATASNSIRIPAHISSAEAAALGVAAVTATLALGVCGGLSFSSVARGPDLLSILRTVDEERIPGDVRKECRQGISREERLSRGDWLVIWGASSVCAFMASQLARLVGLRTILVVDTAKHGNLLSSRPGYRADFVVDSKDPERAIEIIRAVTDGGVRFGIDCAGKVTAGHLLRCLSSPGENHGSEVGSEGRSEPPSPADSVIQPYGTHLIGLTGLPKDTGDVTQHNVPVKVFHDVPEVGNAIVLWLERLLEQRLLDPPQIIGTVEGLEGVNDGLDRMRKGEVSGGRLVALIDP